MKIYKIGDKIICDSFYKKRYGTIKEIGVRDKLTGKYTHISNQADTDKMLKIKNNIIGCYTILYDEKYHPIVKGCSLTIGADEVISTYK